MRILQADKFFYNRGGSSKVFFDTILGLRERGHQVIEFSVQNEKNLFSDYSKYFISPIPELKGEMPYKEKWRVFKHLFYSKEVVDKLEELINTERPEVAHLHNVYHHLSASIFETLNRHRVPIVLTLHDVFPLCPNHSLLRGETLDEEVFKNKPYNCVRYRCIDNRLLPSIAGTLEAYYYRYKKIWDMVDCFICPSEFMKYKMAEYGFDAGKMQVVKNPYSFKTEIKPLGNKIAYIGRLHFEKGIKIFMEAVKNLPEFKFVIAGDGPEENWAKEFVQKNNLKNVELVGWIGEEKREKIFEEARIVVVPSVFLENCSLTILESLARGRLVVASQRGGNPELVINGQTGFLCRPEDPIDLAEKIIQAMAVSDESVGEIQKNGLKLLIENHDPNEYFKQVVNVYTDVSKNK